MVPHHDYHRARYALLDLLVGAALGILALHWFSTAGRLWGGLGGVAPDLEVAVDHILLSLGRRRLGSHFPSHTGLLPHPPCAPVPGMLIQVAVVAAGLVLLRH